MIARNLRLHILIVLFLSFGLAVSAVQATSTAPPINSLSQIVMDEGLMPNPLGNRVDAPSGVDASDGYYNDRIEITWDPVSEVDHYELYVSSDNDNTYASQCYYGSNTSYDDYDVNGGAYYYYWVKACDSIECSDFSISDEGWAFLDVPSNVTASDGLSSSYIEISWSSGSRVSSPFDLYRNDSNDSNGASLVEASVTSPYQDPNVDPGKYYYYWLKACGDEEALCSEFSTPDDGYMAFDAPSGVTASDGLYSDRVEIEWNLDVSGIYEIFRNSINESSSATSLGTEYGSPYLDTTAMVETTYYYWVKTCGPDECSDFSTPDSGYRSLAIPTDVAASDGTSTAQVTITWTGTSDATHYELWRNTSNNSSTAIQRTPDPTTPVFNDTTAAPGTLYYYWVKACTSTVCTDFSNADTGYRAIAAPTGLTATNGTSTDYVRLQWTGPTGATYYEIWRNTTNNSTGASLIGSPSVSPYQDTSAVAGTLYFYWVKGCSSTGCSAFSNGEDGYRALLPPAGVSATDGTSTAQVTITWTAVTGATEYTVWRYTSDNSGSASLLGGTAGTSYNDTTAVVGTRYFYWLKACASGAGCSAFSLSDSGYRNITPPATVTASNGTYTGYTRVIWSTASPSTSYEIWRNATDSTGTATKIYTSAGSPYDDTSATVGLIYYYWVKGCNSVTCSDFSLSDHGYRAIATPTGFSATDGLYPNRVDTSWISTPGATFYNVYRSTTDNSAGASKISGDVTSTAFSDTTAATGTLYYYWVKGCCADSCSAFSTVNTGYSALNPPSAVIATDGVHTDKVVVSWAGAPSVTSYQVWRNTTNDTGTASQIGTPTATSYDDSTAAAGTLYYYWVKGCISAGCSAFSAPDTGFKKITPPTGLSVSDGASLDYIRMIWNASAGATSYKVFRNTVANPDTATLLGSPAALVYDDTSAIAGTTYYYWVQGCNALGCSGFSSSDTGYRLLPAPGSLSASEGSYTDKVLVTWGSVTGATYYEVYRYTSDNVGSATLVGSPSTNTHDDSTAESGKIYYYWVKACSSLTCSTLSSSDSGYKGVSAPINVSASDGTYTDRIEITWEASIWSDLYKVLRNTTNNPAGATLLDEFTWPLSYTDTSATAGGIYYYWIVGCNWGHCSDYSTPDTGYLAIIPPADLTASDGTFTDKIQLTWTASRATQSFQVWRNTENSSETASMLTDGLSSGPYDDTTTAPGTTYYYWVKQCSPAYCSAFSEPDSGYRAIVMDFRQFLPLILN